MISRLLEKVIESTLGALIWLADLIQDVVIWVYTKIKNIFIWVLAKLGIDVFQITLLKHLVYIFFF